MITTPGGYFQMKSCHWIRTIWRKFAKGRTRKSISFQRVPTLSPAERRSSSPRPTPPHTPPPTPPHPSQLSFTLSFKSWLETGLGGGGSVGGGGVGFFLLSVLECRPAETRRKRRVSAGRFYPSDRGRPTPPGPCWTQGLAARGKLGDNIAAPGDEFSQA